MIGPLVIAIVLACAAPRAQSPVSMPDPYLIRVSVGALIAALTPDEAGTRQSVKDLSFELAARKKTLAVVDDPRDADVEVQIVSRSSTPTPPRSVVLRVTVTSGDQRLEFTNQNKPLEAEEGWKSAAGDLASQIDEWVAAHRDEIMKRRHRRPAPGTDADIQGDFKGVDFGPWLRRFVTEVKRNWYVPESLLGSPSPSFVRGRVVVAFSVLKDGTIADARIESRSFVAALDNASLDAITRMGRTQPLPPEYPDERAKFKITFHYNDR